MVEIARLLAAWRIEPSCDTAGDYVAERSAVGIEIYADADSAGAGEFDIFGANRGARREQRSAYHGVFELAHVAGPLRVFELVARFGADRVGPRAHLLRRLADEVTRQLRDIFAPLAQRRHLDRDYAKAEVQVLAEFALRDQDLEVLVGRGDYARLQLERLDAADPVELALLQHAQQLRLQLDRQVANFVEEDRAGVGHLEFAGSPLGRSPE